jgi:hypothetical protein
MSTYNPYRSHPDWGQGISDLATQLIQFMMMKNMMGGEGGDAGGLLKQLFGRKQQTQTAPAQSFMPQQRQLNLTPPEAAPAPGAPQFSLSQGVGEQGVDEANRRLLLQKMAQYFGIDPSVLAQFIR